ncbi:hypothetical protein [Ammoniphilus sp. 3BR4]|uniref:hypothetical protein n=1 Tax=Ammoniphilus sp. 3BR4 TaxID=3158265 RepID=UPI00346563B7
MGQIPLIYTEWDETALQPKEVLAQVAVDQGVLFLRKLANATVIRNQLFEHTSNESDGRESLIYLQPLRYSHLEEKDAIEKAVFSRHDIAPKYEAEYWTKGDHNFIFREMQRFDQAMDAAQVLLDHYVHFHGTHYEILYAVLDPARRKLLLFLKRTAFSVL